MLERCLLSLSAQSESVNWELEGIHVVINAEHEAGAEELAKLEEWRALYWVSSHPLEAIVEDRVGIPFARNRALDWAAEKGIAWVLFIDDDCIAERDLVFKLTECANFHSADVVAGGWSIQPEGRVSSWIPLGVYGVKDYQFDTGFARDGDFLPTAYTRNVLFHTATLAALSPEQRRFSETLSDIGGSDTRFFFGLSAAGAKIVYCREARVTEIFTGGRNLLRWHLRRRIRNAQQRVLRAPLTGERVASVRLVIKSLVELLLRTPVSLVLLLASPFSVRVSRWVGSTLLKIAPYLGVALLMVGLEFREYAGKFRFRPIREQRIR